MTVKKKVAARKKQLIQHDPFEAAETAEENNKQVQQSEVGKPLQAQHFDLGLSLTIEEAEEHKKALMELIVEGGCLQLNGENIEQIDAAGLQLLAAFFGEIEQRQLDVSWTEVSKPLYQAAQLVGLDDALKMQTIEIQDDGEGTAWGLF